MCKLRLLLLPALLLLCWPAVTPRFLPASDWADQCIGRPVAEQERLDAEPQSYGSRNRLENQNL